MTNDDIFRIFHLGHLPPHLAQVSAVFRDTAVMVANSLPPSADRTKCINELWQAKNWAVLAAVAKHAAERDQEKVSKGESPLPLEHPSD